MHIRYGSRVYSEYKRYAFCDRLLTRIKLQELRIDEAMKCIMDCIVKSI